LGRLRARRGCSSWPFAIAAASLPTISTRCSASSSGNPVSALRSSNLPFGALWLVDAEYVAQPGERPKTVALCGREPRSGCSFRLWHDELGAAPPCEIGPDALFVSFVAQAEFSVFLAHGWPLPVNVLDLYCEFRRQLNGWQIPVKRSLVGALEFHGLPTI